MVLVNGSKGIGTGFSTDIMCYNPLDIMRYLKSLLESDIDIDKEVDTTNEFIPYYEGFKGNINKISEGKFLIKGCYEKTGQDKIKVTELPVGYWTEDFKELLENLIEPGVDKEGKKIVAVIKDYDDMSRDTTVDFNITFAKGKLDELEASKLDHGCNGVEKLLKLFTTNTTSNMHLFDAKDKLKKYGKVEDIIDDYYETRLKLYQTRKEHMIKALEKELMVLSNKAKYIKEILDDTIDLRKKKTEEVTKMLKEKGYDTIDGESSYTYLTRMPMDSVTEENVEKLNKQHENKKAELESVKNTTKHQMWLSELETLKSEYLNQPLKNQPLKKVEPKSNKKVVSKGSLKPKINL
jgi:DNA topoisomerase-2